MEQTQLSKRERNKEAVKEQLLESAKVLFSDKGFDNTTVADIVSACNLGRGTFYNYYKDVKDLFDAVVNEINAQIGVIVKQARAKADNIYDMFYNSFKAYFDFVSSDELLAFHQQNQAYIRSASFKSDPIRNIVRDLYEDILKIKEDTIIKSEKEIYLLCYVYIGTPTELFLNNLSLRSDYNNEEVASFLAQLFTNGLPS